MSTGDLQQEARQLLESGDVSLLRLWILYWGQGGNADEVELDAYIHGIPLLGQFEAEILGWAMEPLLTR
jgi:hypothetical protein